MLTLPGAALSVRRACEAAVLRLTTGNRARRRTRRAFSFPGPLTAVNGTTDKGDTPRPDRVTNSFGSPGSEEPTHGAARPMNEKTKGATARRD